MSETEKLAKRANDAIDRMNSGMKYMWILLLIGIGIIAYMIYQYETTY